MTRAPTCLVPRPAQRGMTLIGVLIALVVFAFGMLGLARAYETLLAAQTGNEQAADTAAFGNRFWALLQAQPALLGQLGATGTTTYTAANASSAPAALQPLLNDIFVNAATRLPSASVAITPGADARGLACSTAPATQVCGVRLVLSWQAPGSTLYPVRRQSFNYQVGF